MNKHVFPFCLFLFAAFAHAAPREEWFRNLSLDFAVANSDLILAAEVSGVTQIKLMRGGKGESEMYQYKFKPARMLKGVFARDELSLGSSDLGLYRSEDMKQIRPGDFLLIFLGRSDAGYTNSNRNNGAVTQSMPPLRDAGDPLLEAVRTLLAVHAEGDRVNRVALLIDGLNRTAGAGAVALLHSLEGRALPAAQSQTVAGAVAKLMTDPSPAVREAAAHAFRAILEADYLEQAPLREFAVAGCIQALRLPDPNTFARAAAMRALGAAGDVAARSEDATSLLNPPALSTTIERAADLRALGDLKRDAGGAGIESSLSQVPLDDEGEYAGAAEYGLARIQPGRAAALLGARFRLKLAAGLDARTEIAAMAELPPGEAVPALVEISAQALNAEEKSALAETCGNLARKQPDPRLIGPLSGLLAPDEQCREPAVDALLKIDSDEAAKVLQPHLLEEQNLHRKLEIAEMLGRHGIRDGYAFAIEHASEPWLLEQAVAALAAIKEPQSTARLKEILETSNDLHWNTAAVRALGAMGAREMIPKFLGLTADLRNPLAPSALIALADLGEIKELERVGEGLGSRNERIVVASARAAGKLLALPGVDGEEEKARLLSLLSDPDAEQAPRIAALDALLALKAGNLDPVLASIAREAKLENSELLSRVEKLMRERKVKV